MPVEPLPCDDGGGGTPVEVTTCCAPSIASAPLCRADGTTVLAVVRSGCVECGQAAEDPEVVGWLDVAGTFTAGALPADVGPCEAGCVDTVCRQLCDDTDGDGQADATYSELWCIRADGTAELVLTYQDDPSVPYTPVAPVECTYGCPEGETVTLCDDSGPFLRRYAWLNGVASYEDVALDGGTPHVVTGTVRVCAGEEGEPCAEQTTPAATLGLCLADGTPIAVLVTRDCAGTVTQDGWLHLPTGTYTSGPPPAGAQACGDSRAFELAGLLCDTDPATGDVYGLVLVEYAYAPDGSLASVRLVDPATGATYTLQGELRRCPGGPDTGQPEQDLTVLCDTAADGTVTSFVRDYRRDPASGLITGHTDYALDGTAYTPAGTVGVCGPVAEECRNTSSVLLCDLPTGGTPETTAADTNPTPYYPYPTGAPVAGAQTLWDGGTLDLPPGTAPQPGTTGSVNSLAAVLQAPRPACDTGTAHVTVSLNVQQTGPDNACGQTGHLRLFNGTTQTALNVLPANTPAGYFATLTVEADVPAADLAAGAVAFALALDAYDDNPAVCAPSPRRTGWQLSGFTVTAVYDQTGCATQILRNVVTDCETGQVVSVEDTTLDGQPYTVTGEVGQCTTASGTECCPQQPPEPCRNTFTMLLCDESSDVTWTQVSVDQDPASPPGQGWLYRLSPTDDPATVATIRVTTSQSDAILPCAGNGPRWYGNWTTFVYELDTVAQTIPTLRINALDFDRAESLTMLTGMPNRFGGNAYTTGNGVIRSNEDNGTGYIFFDGPPATFSYRFSGACTAISFDAVSSRTTQFLRTLVTDCETGAVLSVTDTTLDGQPYEATGDVGQCTTAGGGEVPPPEPCRNASTLLVCDLPGDGEPTPTVTDTDPTPYDAGTPGTDPVTGGAAALWTGGVLTIPPDTTPAADGYVQRLRSFASTVQAPRPGCDTGNATVTASVRVERDGPDPGCFGTGLFSLIAGGSPVATVGVAPPSVPVGTVQVLTVTATVPAADLAAGTVALVGRLETYHLAPGSCPGTGPGGARIGGWIVDDFTVSVTYDQTGCAQQVFANVVTDCETGTVESVTYTLPDGTPYVPQGTIGQCETSGGACCPEPPCPARSVIEQCRCDDADGDGLADTDYVELLGVDCTGAVTSLGTYLPDLSAPYAPVAPVPCGETDEGADPAFGVQARRIELAAGASWDATAWPTLQSVTALAHGGTGTVTTADGTSTLHQGEAATWSVARDEDAALTGPLTIAAGSGTATVTVSFTIGVTL